MIPKHGLVIGKFYPPHAGHHLLVRTAAACCARVTVVAMASRVESISLEERVAWLREVHAPDENVTVVGARDDHPIDLRSDAIWRAHVAIMVEAARSVTPEPVDAVFTSEAYGEELAARLGARHVPVDPERALVPISGTRVRADPLLAWPFLAAPVRGGLARRVVVVGAESTGKTTLAAELAAALRARSGPLDETRWVPEAGREWTVSLLARERARARLEGRPPPTLDRLAWTEQDFVRIAAEQARREHEAARAGGPLLICDTDAFATGVWHERYLGRRSPEVERVGSRAALYLLTHPADVPFAQDGLRDGEHVREWMTGVFAERLTGAGHRWQWLRGGREERLASAVRAVDALLAEGWGLAAPPG